MRPSSDIVRRGFTRSLARRKMRPGFRSMRRTVFTVRLATLKTLPRTSTGSSRKVAEGRIIRTCSLIAAAVTGTLLPVAASANQPDRGSLLTTYLRARADDDAGRLEAAAAGYATVLAARPTD